MEKIVIEMPLVSRCDVTQCGYNLSQHCHAKAITIGDLENPGCDTFFKERMHNKEAKRMAGVGACKVSDCRYNEDFECNADKISVGFISKNINCLTYTLQDA